MTHTPGPWTFDRNLGCKTIRGVDTEIADTVGLSPEDEDLANALLIARAPELQAESDRRLALLKRANRYLDHTEDCALNFNDQVCDCRLSKLRLELAEELK